LWISSTPFSTRVSDTEQEAILEAESAKTADSTFLEAAGWRSTFWRTRRRFMRNVGAMVGSSLLALILLVGLFANVICPYDPIEVNVPDHLQSPSRVHLFGTDQLGRDVFSRVVAGTRVSLRVVIIVLSVAAIIGVPLGLKAGYLGGLVDDIIMRLTDIFLAFPSFILAMAIAAGLGRSLEYAILSVAIVSWPIYARLIRAQVLSIKNEGYTEAARGIGASNFRILFRHVLPNCLAPLVVVLTINAGNAILATAGLSFVGLGAQPPTPEWGSMLSNSRQFVTTHWWLSAFPGLAISLTVAGYVFLGDGLRDLLDPRLKVPFHG
jgi:peptide/nickel transport system permease protein